MQEMKTEYQKAWEEILKEFEPLVQRSKERNKITNKWAHKHSLKIKEFTLIELGASISNSASERSSNYKKNFDRMTAQASSEADFANRLHRFLVGSDSVDDNYLRFLRKKILDLDGNEGYIVETLALIIEHKSRDVERFSSESTGSRKQLLTYLTPIFLELKKRKLEQPEQIKIVSELFIELGYKNSKGKGDSKTVYSDVYQLKYEFDNPPLK